MTRLLRAAILLSIIPVLAFGQRGGGSRGGGGGGARSGGGGSRGGGGSGVRGGSVGSFRGGSVGGGRIGGGSVAGGFRGSGTRTGGFRSGGNFRGSGFRGNTVVRVGGFGNRFYGGYGFYSGYGYGYGYPYYPYSYYPYSYDPYYYDSNYGSPYYGSPYYDNGYYDNVGYTAQPYASPAPPTVINQNIGGGTVGTTAGAPGQFYRAADYYLIAFADHTIRAAISYTVEGDQLRYTTREHEERTAPVSSVDVRFSEQINRDRRVEFRLP